MQAASTKLQPNGMRAAALASTRTTVAAAKGETRHTRSPLQKPDASPARSTPPAHASASARCSLSGEALLSLSGEALLSLSLWESTAASAAHQAKGNNAHLDLLWANRHTVPIGLLLTPLSRVPVHAQRQPPAVSQRHTAHLSSKHGLGHSCIHGMRTRPSRLARPWLGSCAPREALLVTHTTLVSRTNTDCSSRYSLSDMAPRKMESSSSKKTLVVSSCVGACSLLSHQAGNLALRLDALTDNQIDMTTPVLLARTVVATRLHGRADHARCSATRLLEQAESRFIDAPLKLKNQLRRLAKIEGAMPHVSALPGDPVA
ncbi:hypothetical protein CDD81_389 [Ophiocordyceps australis]|uniref:Uncharacterized protein n=1 Tax=Ophiocordyceps australis TaxID=1399860 RepID=A0A2C5XG59_9HYPO|nr:hypothetical protein CDD81_389 [Ophiocordyceps australis]